MDTFIHKVIPLVIPVDILMAIIGDLLLWVVWDV